MDHNPVGFFDSGEGGLTVARVVAGLLPGEDLVYVCDTARFPYGPRPLSEARRFFLQFMPFFASHRCKLIVVACNTAATAALDLLDRLPVPAIGVVRPGPCHWHGGRRVADRLWPGGVSHAEQVALEENALE